MSPAWRIYLPLLIVLAAAVLCRPAAALEPPRPGMIEELQAQGLLGEAQARAKALGTYAPKVPLRGAASLPSDPQDLADQIATNIGRSLDGRTSSEIRQASATDLGWVELDLNHDRMVDERDVLALGFPQPKETAAFPSIGTSKTFCILVDFPDYPRHFTLEDLYFRLFDEGDTAYYYRSLHYYYAQASYSQLNIAGSVYLYTAPHERAYYHPNDNNSYATDDPRQKELVEGAILQADANGADFSQFDNDGDGQVDYFLVVYTGPVGGWATYWWGYFGVTLSGGFSVDGVGFGNGYSWQWEQYYGFGGSPPNPPNWDPLVTIHETGHALGLPDYYDYDGSVGPDGGVGGLDMMDGNWGDHNCFSKYLLGWYTPTVAFTNLDNEQLQKSYSTGDSVIFTHGFDPVSPWSEYFIAQNRFAGGIDASYPTSGLLIWHVDARVNQWGGFNWNNSYSSHKLLRLMEADGQEDIENNRGVNAGDFYVNSAGTGKVLTPGSNPNSNKYDGTNPGIRCEDISAAGQIMTADFNLYSSNPPTVDITAPSSGSTVSGNAQDITFTATDDGTIGKVQLLIDNKLVKTWTSFTSPQTYTWNTLVEFNGTCTITVRAWDNGDQVGSDTISVTVDNAGVTSVSDGFTDGLVNWRAYGLPLDSRGSSTEWSTRVSPDMSGKLSTGNEAWVKPATSSTEYGADDYLRSQRIDATGYAHPLKLRFYYRCRSGLEVLCSSDNGASWDRIDTIAPSGGWAEYSQHFHLAGQTVYLMLHYTGSVQENADNGLGANIDDVVIAQLASDPPTVEITAPADGATVGGNMTVTADASDDVSVSSVKFYVNNSLVKTDTAAPYDYTRNTVNDDNHPALPIKAIATDGDGTPSDPDEISVQLYNAKVWPVREDIESNANWGTQNYAPTPDWAWVDNMGRSGTHSYGWVLGGAGDGNNWEGFWYNGHADLGGPAVTDPRLKFFYRGDMPSTATVHMYMYNSWTGFMYLGNFSGDQPDWHSVQIPLNSYIGYSGRLTWWIGNSTTDGSGVWIDDLRVENVGPSITTISPTRGIVATTVTINGSNFGATRGGSYVVFGGNVNAADADYVAWGNTQLQVKIPAGAISGEIAVVVSDTMSNGANLRVLLSPPDLDGLVQK